MSVQQIEDALARQVLEGGEIDTALLELDAAPENVLNGYRAASYGFAAASREQLMRVSPEVLARVPALVASRHRVVPIGHAGDVLIVVCAQPLDGAALREIEREVGVSCDFRIATEVRVEAALAAHYGFEIAPRMRRLAEHVALRAPGVLPSVEAMLVTHPADSFVNELFGPDSDSADGDDDDDDEHDEQKHDTVSAEPMRPSFDNLGDAVRAASGAPAVNPEEHARRESVPAPRPRASELPPSAATPTAAGVAPSVEVTRMVSISEPPPLPAPPALLPQDTEPPRRGLRRNPPADVLVGLAAPRLPSEAQALRAASASARPKPRRSRMARKGPLFPSAARELLEIASDRDDVVDVLFSYARQYFETTALFSVRDDRAFGIESYNTPAVDDVGELSILFEAGSALSELARSPLPRVVDLSRKDADHALALALGCMCMRPSALIPVYIGRRLVSFVYGDRAGELFRVDEIADLVELLPLVSRAFERIIRDRKLFAMQAQRPAPAPKPESVPAPPAATATPQAAWSSLPPAQPVAAPSSLRPHEQPTPIERPSRSTPSFSITSEPRSRTSTARGMPRSSAPPPPEDAPIRAAAAAQLSPPAQAQPLQRSHEARAALSSLGVPRTAPPPPPSIAREQLERQPTMQLPVQRGLPPSAAARPDTASLDTNEPPETPRPRPSRPPAPQVRVPPGTGAYKMQGGSEVVGRAASRPPEPAGRSSRPPTKYSAADRPAEIITIPPPPALPTPPPIDAQVRATRRREHAAAITQPLGPKRPSKRPPAQDGRRDDEEDEHDDPASTDVVRMSKALRDSLRPAALPKLDEPAARSSVDASAQHEQLVADLCRCGPDDEERVVQALLRSGDAVLPVLARHFPGPLWFDRKRAHPRLPMGRDVSAIARALSAFGARAYPQLAELLCDADADTRFYATLLVSDHVAPPLLSVLGERLFDADPQIRLLVKDVLPLYREQRGFDDVVQALRDRAGRAEAPIQDRLAALDALAVLRDAGSIPLLIRLNEHADKQLSVPAHRTLSTITAQDFGASTRKWLAWYDENSDRHRVEWLIDGLMHGDQPVRATAGIELQKLTQVYYGYVAAAPKKERERTQRRYQDWWTIEGRRRFRR